MSLGPPTYDCVTRTDCTDHGDCVNGACKYVEMGNWNVNIGFLFCWFFVLKIFTMILCPQSIKICCVSFGALRAKKHIASYHMFNKHLVAISSFFLTVRCDAGWGGTHCQLVLGCHDDAACRYELRAVGPVKGFWLLNFERGGGGRLFFSGLVFILLQILNVF